MKTKLIFPTGSSFSENEEVNWEGCEYSKCGRTDRGVSAFGQVIGLRVRSNRPLPKEESNSGEIQHDVPNTKSSSNSTGIEPAEDAALESDENSNTTPIFDPIKDEIQYPQVLNRVLPPDIRVLAWCPSPPPNFSARFSCRERRYRYFFTQPAFTPTPGNSPNQPRVVGNNAVEGFGREGWLDIEAMKEAAKRYEGLHDFRNLCKIDSSKQIEDFRRRIFLSVIQEVGPEQLPAAYVNLPQFSESISEKHGNDMILAPNGYPKLYCFVLHGSAFLWHQVRHMVAILFLVGQGLESPEVVNKLLDIQQNPQRPMYEMADDAPLVLWDCIFPNENSDSREDALDWIYVGGAVGSGKFGIGGVVDDLWENWRQKKIDEVLAGSLLNVAASQGITSKQDLKTSRGNPITKQGAPKIFLGGSGSATKGQYIPLLKRKRMETVETINARYSSKKRIDSEMENSKRDEKVQEAITSQKLHSILE